MSLGAKDIGGHTIQVEQDLNSFTRNETHTCLECGLSADNLEDLLALNCSHD